MGGGGEENNAKAPLRTSASKSHLVSSSPCVVMSREQATLNLQRFIRAFIARKQFDTWWKLHDHRTRVMNELLETERSYVRGLKLVIEVQIVTLLPPQGENLGKSDWVQDFMGTARADKSGKYASDQIVAIFGPIEDIQRLNSELLSHFEESWHNWTTSSKIGPIFLNIVCTRT